MTTATTTNAAADTVIITMATTTNAAAVTVIITMATTMNAAAVTAIITTTTIMVTAKAVALAAVAEDCQKYSSFRVDRRRACDENIVVSPNLFSSNSAGVVKVRSAVGNGL